jgi:UDP-N-acetyl-D-mannosaminuronic acid dehydrogenase
VNYPSTRNVLVPQSDKPQADLTVIGGAGHVGVPLVLSVTEADLTVNVNDIDEAGLARLRSGKLPLIEHGAAPQSAKALANNRLVFASSPAASARSGPLIVAIGTRSMNSSIRCSRRCSGASK